MTSDEWRSFLTEYNYELLKNPKELHNCPTEVAAAGWLGFPPATEEQIQATETRLGKRLPPSLRNFYTVTNGWHDLSSFIWEIFPVEKLDWLAVHQPNLFQPQEFIETELRSARDDQDREWIREEYVYVNRSLVITDWGDACCWLLDPERPDGQGEWPGGRWASWNPGMDWTATSFAELMQNERRKLEL
nr:SMI1/KNR4 family protein [Armatimonas sp.]